MIRRSLLRSLAVLAVGCAPRRTGLRTSPKDKAHPLLGKPAPAIELPDLEAHLADSYRLTAGGKKLYLVDFWATWCAPCRTAFPFYERLTRKYPNIQLIAVSVDEESESIPEFVEATGAEFKVLWDRNQRVADAFDPPAMPCCFFLDEQLIVRAVHEGFESGAEELIEQRVQSLLQG